MKAVKICINPPKTDAIAAIDKIIKLAFMARKEGVLILEEAVKTMEDPFLEKGIMLVVDATEPELVRNILETELMYIEGRHGEIKSTWEFMGTVAPAWGLVGTLVGLIVMLGDMSDPDALGPNMAIALITTFYGSLVANLVANPIASKLKLYSKAEVLTKEVLIEGILSIQAGENPRIIEEKLKSFIAPSLREAIGEERKEKEGE